MPRTATPLQAVDEVIVLSATEVVATKRIVADDPYLAGHFPGRPIYPGVFVVESVRQALGALLSEAAGGPRTAELAALRSLRLFAPLVPGDTLTVHVVCTADRGGPLVASARCSRADGGRIAQVSVELAGVAGADPPPSRAPVPFPTVPVAAPAVTGPDAAVTGPDAAVTGPGDLHRLLAHRHPMLLVDCVGAATVVAGGPGSTLHAAKAVTLAEPCYAELGPDDGYAYPAALLLESFLQSAAVLWVQAVPAIDGGTMVLGGTGRVAFPSRAYPGDVVRHRLRLDGVRGGTAVLSGCSVVAGRPERPVLDAASVVIARRVLDPVGEPAATGAGVLR